LQQAGFNLRVYDNAPAANPNIAFGQAQIYCGEALAQCGEPLAQCASFDAELIVNGNIVDTVIDYIVQCDEPLAQCGEPTALVGNYSGVSLNPIEYEIPGGGLIPFFRETYVSEEAVIANSGTIFGSPVIDNGAVLDSSSKYITYPYSKALTELTIVTDIDATFDASRRQHAVTNQLTLGSSLYFTFGFNNEASTTAKKLFYKSAAATIASTTTTSPGRHEYAMSLNNSGQIKFYVDGVQLGSTVGGASFGASGPQPELWIGRTPPFPLSAILSTMHDTRLYDSVLVPDDWADPPDTTTRLWNFIFFVGGDVVRNPSTGEILFIDFVDIPIQNRDVLRQLILKYKPEHSWCILAVNWV
jgi:hypothetical protein